MPREQSIAEVRAYLTSEFPDCAVEDREAGGFEHLFQISRQVVLHLLRVTNEFLDDRPPSEVQGLLGAWRVADLLRESGREPVLLQAGGARIA